MTQDGTGPTPDPEDRAPLPSADAVLDDIERGTALEPSRLRALSEPTDETLRRVMAMWP